MFKQTSVALAQLEALLQKNAAALERLTQRQRDYEGVAERRWNYINGELNRIEKKVELSEADIVLSHVDAPNIKVHVTLSKVVQALADHLNLGMVPEADAEIVVINEP